MNNAARMLLIQSLLESKVCLSHAGPGSKGGQNLFVAMVQSAISRTDKYCNEVTD